MSLFIKGVVFVFPNLQQVYLLLHKQRIQPFSCIFSVEPSSGNAVLAPWSSLDNTCLSNSQTRVLPLPKHLSLLNVFLYTTYTCLCLSFSLLLTRLYHFSAPSFSPSSSFPPPRTLPRLRPLQGRMQLLLHHRCDLHHPSLPPSLPSSRLQY